jgi:hypothetical protein
MREDFLDAWSRYLPDDPVGPPPIESATSATPLHNGHAVDGYGSQPMCRGCGTYYNFHGEHRADCTAIRTEGRR